MVLANPSSISMTFKCLFSLVRGGRGLSHENLLLKNCSVSSHLEKGENVSKIHLSCASSKIGLKSLGLRQKGVFDILIGSRSSILVEKGTVEILFNVLQLEPFL